MGIVNWRQAAQDRGSKEDSDYGGSYSSWAEEPQKKKKKKKKTKKVEKALADHQPNLKFTIKRKARNNLDSSVLVTQIILQNQKCMFFDRRGIAFTVVITKHRI